MEIANKDYSYLDVVNKSIELCTLSGAKITSKSADHKKGMMRLSNVGENNNIMMIQLTGGKSTMPAINLLKVLSNNGLIKDTITFIPHGYTFEEMCSTLDANIQRVSASLTPAKKKIIAETFKNCEDFEGKNKVSISFENEENFVALEPTR